VLDDPALAAFVGERPAEERAALIERALRVGLTAIQSVGVTVNVDAVRAEFQGLLRQTEAANERAATALDQTLRQNFADGEGQLPRTLEKFLGDKGQLRGFVDDLFDEAKRDSAIGRMKSLLGTYFDGDASRLAQLLDPTRLGSPLHQFRTEMAAGFKEIGEKLAALEAAGAARASERSRSTAKGADFEDAIEAMLGELARGSGDILERTGTDTGALMTSKKGDFVLTLNADATAGADLRVVVECKDRYVSGRAMRDELREAKSNRDAAVAVVVFTPLMPRPASPRSMSGRGTSTASWTRPRRMPPLSKPRSGWPGCWRCRRCAPATSRWTQPPSPRLSRASASSSRRSAPSSWL